MESDKIEILLERYFEGETSIAEEKELKAYFASPDVAQHLEQYKPMFGFFAAAKEQKPQQKLTIPTDRTKNATVRGCQLPPQ
ncbi:hypothetical protein [Flavobacterium sp. 3HN19-14]|uniref:hypothetical protein n=1 Tax=Flavobacterium sp. 3HN19-14 TaxID=3448133 RepID=UPI003EE1BE08